MRGSIPALDRKYSSTGIRGGINFTNLAFNGGNKSDLKYDI